LPKVFIARKYEKKFFRDRDFEKFDKIFLLTKKEALLAICRAICYKLHPQVLQKWHNFVEKKKRGIERK
jgi:N-acetylglutamate synthase-like GNAT family acetyltransferase